MIDSIAVFCSARDNIAPQYLADARAVGDFIGRNGLRLVYGGIALGLMEITADAAAAHGVRIVGVVPSSRKENASQLSTETILVDSLHDRKKNMEELSDVFIVLPGGFGTLDELFSVWASLTFYYDNEKEILIDNREGLYDPLIRQLELMVDEHLLSQKALDRLRFFGSAEEMLEYLRNKLENEKK